MLREVLPEFPPHVLPLPCNVSVNATSLWHHCLLVVNMVFTKEHKVAMKFLHENKLTICRVALCIAKTLVLTKDKSQIPLRYLVRRWSATSLEPASVMEFGFKVIQNEENDLSSTTTTTVYSQHWSADATAYFRYQDVSLPTPEFIYNCAASVDRKRVTSLGGTGQIPVHHVRRGSGGLRL